MEEKQKQSVTLRQQQFVVRIAIAMLPWHNKRER